MEAQRYLYKVGDRTAQTAPDVTGTVRVGDPGAQLIEFLNQRPLTRVVLNTHSAHGAERWVFGDVVEAVLTYTSVLTLVLRATDVTEQLARQSERSAPVSQP